MTANDVSTALRPFFFRVHPDKFHRYPKEMSVNENSLKLLQEYLSNLIHKKDNFGPVRLHFFLQEHAKDDQISATSMKEVKIELNNEDINTAVHKILSVCQICTRHIEKFVKSSSQPEKAEAQDDQLQDIFDSLHVDVLFGRRKDRGVNDIIAEISKKPVDTLLEWLSLNTEAARLKQDGCKPVLEEIYKLSCDLREELGLKDLIFDTEWTASHFRGCLNSMKTLAVQYPQDMHSLRGRILAFGSVTGVGFDGRIMLNVQDVRHNWLNMLRHVHQFDAQVKQVPEVAAQLSKLLNGMRITHRKFGPVTLVQTYIQQLSKLRKTLEAHKRQSLLPSSCSKDLSRYKLVVEGDAGPLMVSPTGQFIAPSSCPSKIFVDFICSNLKLAGELLDAYESIKIEEVLVMQKCLFELGLVALDKDDNVTPDLMIKCCDRLVENKDELRKLLTGVHLRISHHFSLLQDGRICIPWNWVL